MTAKHSAEREIKQIAKTLFLDSPTTTKEGAREYKRLERHVQEIVKQNKKLSLWQKMRANFVENMKLLDEELAEFQKKRGK